MMAAAWILAAAAAAPASGHEDGLIADFSVRRARIDETFDLLRQAARAADEHGESYDIVYRPPAEPVDLPRITLSLRRISLLDAVRIITEVAGLYYRIDGNVVIISHEPSARGRIHRRIYPVNPTLMQTLRSAHPGEEPPPDPFFFRR